MEKTIFFAYNLDSSILIIPNPLYQLQKVREICPKSSDTMKTHEKIRQIREIKKWSQEEIASKLNISAGGYAKIERGETTLTLPRLQQIADIFEIDMLDLIQKEIKQFIYQHNNEGENNQYNVYLDSKPINDIEIEKLNLIITHKDELIEQYKELLAQKNRELAHLEEIIMLLKNQP